MNENEAVFIATKSSGLKKFVEDLTLNRCVWPFPMINSCCGLEFQSLWGKNSGASKVIFDKYSYRPEESDVLIVSGSITKDFARNLIQVYRSMPGPRWVIAVGACACSGGLYEGYSVISGVSKLFPVDVYIPGCPPSLEVILEGLNVLEERVKKRLVANPDQVVFS